jgi:hypothetical protein
MGWSRYEYAWPFVKCTHHTYNMLLKICPFALYTSPLSVQAIPLLLYRCVYLTVAQKRHSSIVACVFVAAGMCLSSLCLAMDVCSGSTIPAFRHHVIVLFINAATASFCLRTATVMQSQSNIWLICSLPI